MTLQQIVSYLTSHRWIALAMALFFSFLPLFGFIPVVWMLFITLRQGPYSGLPIFAVTAIPSVISLFLGNPDNFYFSFLAINLVSYLLAMVLRETASWTKTLQAAGVIAILVIGAIHFFVPNLQSQWFHLFEIYYREAKTDLALRLGVDDLTPVFQLWSTFATGLQATMTLLFVLSNLVLARWMQAVLYNPGGLVKETLLVRLDYSSVVIFIIFTGLSLFSGSLFRDYLPVIYFIFFLAGLSVFHWFLSVRKKWLWFIFYYLSLILLFQWLAPLTIGFAILDVFFDVRRRIIMV